MTIKLSELAIADIKTGRLSLREFAKLYGVHHTSVLRVTKPRVGSGHKCGYYRAYHQKNRDERCREMREQRTQRYWSLWLIRELLRAWGLNADLTAAGVPTWGINTFDPCGRLTGPAISRSFGSTVRSNHGDTSRARLSFPSKEAPAFICLTLR